MPTLLEVRTTFPDIEKATEIARQLVSERLAACVQLLPGVTSVYRWQGMLRHDTEVLCLLKTDTERWTDLRDRLTELHPYETPEILALPVEHGTFEYVAWVREQVL
jgi:periplasmic divalent cation tolerance protein